MGLINKVVPHEELDAAVAEIAERYAKSATKAIGLIKRMLNRSTDSTLEALLELEKHGQVAASQSDDYKEGVAAFLEKRKANFQGK